MTSDYLFESSHPGGTYVCIIPSIESREQIFRFCVELGVSNLVEPDDYHCTIIYSKEACPDVSKEDFGFPIRALSTGFTILGKEKKVLVMEIYCPDATRLHNLFMEKYGATHDYDSYIAHVTIADNFQGEIPVDIFPDEIEFTGMTIEELS